MILSDVECKNRAARNVATPAACQPRNTNQYTHLMSGHGKRALYGCERHSLMSKECRVHPYRASGVSAHPMCSLVSNFAVGTKSQALLHCTPPGFRVFALAVNDSGRKHGAFTPTLDHPIIYCVATHAPMCSPCLPTNRTSVSNRLVYSVVVLNMGQKY